MGICEPSAKRTAVYVGPIIRRTPVKRFSDLTEQEILALAISNEDQDGRIYRDIAQGLRENFPSSARMFDEMAEEEARHRTWLFDLYRRIDDGAGRPRPHPALSRRRLLDCDDRVRHRRRVRALRDFMDPLPVHGYAVPAGDIPGGRRRRAGVSGRDHHRKL